jgi:hypothetical protein
VSTNACVAIAIACHVYATLQKDIQGDRRFSVCLVQGVFRIYGPRCELKNEALNF